MIPLIQIPITALPVCVDGERGLGDKMQLRILLCRSPGQTHICSLSYLPLPNNKSQDTLPLNETSTHRFKIKMYALLHTTLPNVKTIISEINVYYD